jgi:DNA transposition AAA+ family ATPase
MKPSDQWKSQLTTEQESIIAKVETRLATGLTEQRLSLETGVSTEDISRLLGRNRVKNNWEHKSIEDTTTAIASLAEWLGGEADITQIQSGFAVTPTFQSLQALFAQSHKSRQLIAITGSWGIGKSEAAKAYVQSCPRGHRKPGALRIEFTNSDKKPAAAYSKILGALHGEVGHAYRNGNLHDAIGAALNPGDCLIMDECNYLNEAMDVVRSIHDDFGVSIVMIGNPEFKATVWGKKSQFAALASRAMHFEFPNSTAEDIEAWLAWNGVLDGMRPSERAKFIDQAIIIGKRPGPNGGLRSLAHVIDIHANLYRSAPLDGALLTQIANQTKGGLQ